MKKYILLIGALTSIWQYTIVSYTYKKKYTPNQTNRTQHTENNIKIVLFDIHDVIVEKDIRSQEHLKHSLEKRKFKFIKYAFTDRKLFKRLFRAKYNKSDDKKPTTEELIFYARKHPKLQQTIIKIDNARIPIPGTVEIIKKLHAHNIALHIGSNIGKTSFEKLIQQEPYTTIFNYFDITKSKFITYTPYNETIKKPDPRFFSDYLSTLRIQFGMHIKPQQIIFVDNELINVQSAQSVGLRTILFTSSTQLQKELERILGFCLDT